MEETTNHYSPAELSNFNSQLLGRGAPIQKDNFGYNKPDYSNCIHYYDILTNTQLADLSQRLIKYTETQLDIDKSKMQATADYYNSLTNNTNLDNSISIQIGKEYTLIAFSYNTLFIDTIKKAKNRKYSPEQKSWFIANSEVVQVLENLQRKGADCENCIKYLQENLTITESDQQTEQIKKAITVTEKHDKLILNFSYDVNIITAVKSLFERKYNPSEKTWTIVKNEVEKLISKLSQLDNIDYSQLLPFITPAEQVQKIEFELPAELTKIPFTHQIQAAEFLINQKKAILADEMGGGKTFSSILAAANIQGKKLIVCPASLKLNWQKEISVIPAQKIEVINGKGWQECEGWTIVNYDILCKHIDSILASNFATVIFDEVHYCKAITNSGKPGSKRANMFLQIAEKIENVYLLTGTPITNKTKDIFNSLKAINHPLSRKYFAFAQRYCGATHNGYGWSFDGASNTIELHEYIKPHMMRRLKTEMLDLPEKIRSFIPVTINTKEYNKKVQEYMDERESLENKGLHLVHLNAMRHILAKEKVSHTAELAKNLLEQGEQVVIFTNYNYVVDELLKEFGSDAVKLTGDCNQKQRQEAVDQFQTGQKKVFVSNLIAGGVGITLTSANNLIVNDLDWVPANHSQAEDRIHRIGQTEKANITYVYAPNTIDEKMSDLLERKLRNISAVIDGREVSFTGNMLDEIMESF